MKRTDMTVGQTVFLKGRWGAAPKGPFTVTDLAYPIVRRGIRANGTGILLTSVEDPTRTFLAEDGRDIITEADAKGAMEARARKQDKEAERRGAEQELNRRWHACVGREPTHPTPDAGPPIYIYSTSGDVRLTVDAETFERMLARLEARP
jgi:hypothetical protein